MKFREIDINYLESYGYTFSNCGDVMRGGKVVRGTMITDGYLQVSFCCDGKRRRLLTHRVIATKYIPNPRKLPQVNHKDGDKTNNHVDNLEWVSASQNQLHKLGIGDYKADRATAAVRLQHLGYKLTEISKLLGVSITTVKSYIQSSILD